LNSLYEVLVYYFVECSQGPAQLKVKVLDTLHFDKPDIDFITRRPTLQPDHKYIDKEFECSKALGKYLDQFQWKRPQVTYII